MINPYLSRGPVRDPAMLFGREHELEEIAAFIRGTQSVSVVGPLCTPLDRLGDKVALPEARVGDLVAVFLAGAYGASASPAEFLGHGPAAEIVA